MGKIRVVCIYLESNPVNILKKILPGIKLHVLALNI